MQPPSPRGARIGLGVIALVAIGVWAASGFYIVQEGQVAVVTQFGKYKSTSQAGFQWRLPYPIQSHETVNASQLRTFEVGFRGGARNKVLPEALMLTTDENIVDMQFVVQYAARGAPDYLFMTRDPDESVRQASETAMREIVGKQTMDFVLYEGRTTVASQVQALMQQILDRYQTGIQVSTVAIQNVQPPEQVQAAFDDAVKAGQDRERQINEGQAYANQVVPLASGQASRMQEQAEGYKAKVIGDAQGNTARFTSILGEYERRRRSCASACTWRACRRSSRAPARSWSIPRATTTCCICPWTRSCTWPPRTPPSPPLPPARLRPRWSIRRPSRRCAAAPCRPRHLPAAAIATRCLATVRRVNPEDH